MSAIFPVVAGLLIGTVVGALGAGGGVLAIPVLVYLLGQDAHSAAAESLIIVGLTAVIGIIHHVRTRGVAWRDGLIFGALSLVGAVPGARLVAVVPELLLLGLFGTMLMVLAALMVRSGLRTRRQEDKRAAAREADADANAGADTPESAAKKPAHVNPIGRPKLRLLLPAALLTGLLTGFFGVGGGFIVVPMLVMALGVDMRRAAGTSLLVMIMSSTTSLLARVGTPIDVDWPLTLLFAGGSMAGGLIGGPLSSKARPSTLTFLFALLLATAGGYTILAQLLS